jgi:hypothetical protein
MPALPASAQKGADRNVKPIEGLEPLPPSPVTRWRDLPLLPWASAPFSACGLRAKDVTKRDITMAPDDLWVLYPTCPECGWPTWSRR